MKKYIINFIIIVITLQSCATPNFAIGTSEQDFLRMARRAKLESSSVNGTIYKIGDDGMTVFSKYYYFQNGKLIAINGGERIPDMNIRVQNYK